VDRVLNKRHPVRTQTAGRVLAAAEALGYHGTALIRQRLGNEPPERKLGFILQWRSEEFYRNLGAALAEATERAPFIRGRPIVEFLDDLTPPSIVDALHRLAGKAAAIALVAADHPNISQAVEDLHRRGVPVFALLSDLSAPFRAGYLGLDHRKAGRTAAWTISRLARRPGKVAIVIGSHRYLGHELSEISFRSYFREHAPDFQVLEPLVNLEEPRISYEGVLNLLRRNDDLVGIYVAGGGGEGVIAALRESGRAQSVTAVCNELTQATRSGLIDGSLDMVISNPLTTLGEKTVEAMSGAVDRGGAEAAKPVLLPMELYVPENV
jgi:LacI family transcriptional regulator